MKGSKEVGQNLAEKEKAVRPWWRDCSAATGQEILAAEAGRGNIFSSRVSRENIALLTP